MIRRRTKEPKAKNSKKKKNSPKIRDVSFLFLRWNKKREMTHK